MYIGAHVSTAGGLNETIKRGLEVGAEGMQIFPSAPQRWKITSWSDEDCAEFKLEWPKHFKQIVFHGIYLINLAAQLRQNWHLSKVSIVDSMKLAEKLGFEATIIHPGSYQNGQIEMKDQIKEAIQIILDSTPVSTKLIFENSAGSTIGGKLDDLAWLIEISKDKNRVGVCLDTCHAYAAGYDLKTGEGYEKYISEVTRLLGIDKVYCWHINDSKFDLGSKRDRHENIGDGTLGLEAFERIINDPRWRNTVAYLEVPGYGKTKADKVNVDRLKEVRKNG